MYNSIVCCESTYTDLVFVRHSTTFLNRVYYTVRTLSSAFYRVIIQYGFSSLKGLTENTSKPL